jgi:hypothetical protein
MNTTEIYLFTKNMKRIRAISSRTKTRKNNQRLNLTEWSGEKYKTMTRFTYNEIVSICNAIGLEGSLSFKGICITHELSLAILLNCLSFPRRHIDMQYTFGLHKNNISKIVNGLSKLLYEKFKAGIEFDERQFSKENLERFSKTIFEKGAYLPNIIGFIDGKMQQTRRPKDTDTHKLAYNGWKHIHCITFQAISTPDGITSSLCEPYNGNNNCPETFNSSLMLSRLNYHFDEVSPEKDYAVYGDETYSLSKHIILPFNRVTMDEIEKETNVSMSKVRVAVEMEFGKTATCFSGSKWKHGKRILQNKPALKYILAIIFKNIHTCLHGSPISKMFRVGPLTLEEYLNGLMRERNERDILE